MPKHHSAVGMTRLVARWQPVTAKPGVTYYWAYLFIPTTDKALASKALKGSRSTECSGHLLGGG